MDATPERPPVKPYVMVEICKRWFGLAGACVEPDNRTVHASQIEGENVPALQFDTQGNITEGTWSPDGKFTPVE